MLEKFKMLANWYYISVGCQTDLSTY